MGRPALEPMSPELLFRHFAGFCILLLSPRLAPWAAFLTPLRGLEDRYVTIRLNIVQNHRALELFTGRARTLVLHRRFFYGNVNATSASPSGSSLILAWLPAAITTYCFPFAVN